MANIQVVSRAEALLGTYWSSTEGSHVIYESRLELARLLYADFDGAVRHIVAQPFLLKAKVDGQVRKHVPDFLLITEQGPVIVDVKPLARLSDPRIRFTLDWTRQLVEGRCWRCEVWSEPPETQLRNVRFLSGFRNPARFDVSLLAEVRQLTTLGCLQTTPIWCNSMALWNTTAAGGATCKALVPGSAYESQVEGAATWDRWGVSEEQSVDLSPLESGPSYRFSDWPNPPVEVPHKPGVQSGAAGAPATPHGLTGRM